MISVTSIDSCSNQVRRSVPHLSKTGTGFTEGNKGNEVGLTTENAESTGRRRKGDRRISPVR